MDKRIVAKVEEFLHSNKSLIEHRVYAVQPDVERVLEEIYKMRHDDNIPYWHIRYLKGILASIGDDSIDDILDTPDMVDSIPLVYAIHPGEVSRLVSVSEGFPIPFVDKYSRENGKFIRECIDSTTGFVPDIVILYKNYCWFGKKKTSSSGKSTLPET